MELDLLEKDVYKFCFIVDFPMYELSDEGTIDFNHNPFSMPQGGLKALEEKNHLKYMHISMMLYVMDMKFYLEQ